MGNNYKRRLLHLCYIIGSNSNHQHRCHSIMISAMVNLPAKVPNKTESNLPLIDTVHPCLLFAPPDPFSPTSLSRCWPWEPVTTTTLLASDFLLGLANERQEMELGRGRRLGFLFFCLPPIYTFILKSLLFSGWLQRVE